MLNQAIKIQEQKKCTLYNMPIFIESDTSLYVVVLFTCNFLQNIVHKFLKSETIFKIELPQILFPLVDMTLPRFF